MIARVKGEIPSQPDLISQPVVNLSQPKLKVDSPPLFNGNDDNHTILIWLQNLNSYFDASGVIEDVQKLQTLLVKLGKKHQETLDDYYVA